MREQLTESDVKKIEEEIEYRKLVVRKEAIEAVKEARAHGDLSENFEYYAAKKDKNQNESRIRYLERMLKNARVISEDSREDEVGLNNTVQVYFEEDVIEAHGGEPDQFLMGLDNMSYNAWHNEGKSWQWCYKKQRIRFCERNQILVSHF